MREPDFIDTLDVLVIGAGPIGLACGIALGAKHLRYKIVEKGCLVNSLYHYPANMTFFSTADKLEIGSIPFISNNPKATRAEALEYYRRVASSLKLPVLLYEEVQSVHKSDQIYQVITDKHHFKTRAIVLCTGFFDIPNLLDIPGENLAKVHHYFHEAHPYYGQKVLVIGSANSAVDVALETWRKGAEVTMVIKNSRFEDNVKYWAKPDIENRVKEGSIKAYFNSVPTRITDDFVTISTPEGRVDLPNDHVFAMTGYLPNFTFLTSLGITIAGDEPHTPTYNPATMETNQENIYLAGVICGGMNTRKWFIENSRVHAEIIAQDLSKKFQLAPTP